MSDFQQRDFLKYKTENVDIAGLWRGFLTRYFGKYRRWKRTVICFLSLNARLVYQQYAMNIIKIYSSKKFKPIDLWKLEKFDRNRRFRMLECENAWMRECENAWMLECL